MATRKRIKPGDLFSIPLGKDAVAVAIVLHVSKRFRNGMLVGVYDKVFDSLNTINLDLLPKQFVSTPNYTSTRSITEGHWTIIAHRPELLEGLTIPKLRAAGTVYYKDEIVEQLASVQDLHRYPELLGQGEGALELKLSSHFGLSQVV